MAKVYLTAIDMQENEIKHAVLHNVPGPQSTGVPGGKIQYRSDTGDIEWYDAVAGAWKKPGTGEVATHEGAADPHSQYLTQSEGDALYESDGAVAAHEGAADPHAQYQTQAESDARYVNETDFTKAAIDALNVDADTVDGAHAADLRDRSTHTGTQTHTTISDFDTGVRTNRLDQMAAPTTAVGMNNQKITGLATPTADGDAANKGYVDNAIQGLTTKDSVRVATTGNITLSGTQTIDTIGVVAGDRVLVKNQTSSIDDGIYVVSAGAWTRAADANSGEELLSAFVFVEEGAQNANSGWLQTYDNVTIGASEQLWVQFSGAGQISAGLGLGKSGNSLFVIPGTGITVDDFGVGLDAEYVTDLVGGMVSGNTEAGITVTYRDTDNTIDFTLVYGLETVALDGLSSTGLEQRVARSDHKHAIDKAAIDALDVDAGTLDGLDSTAFATGDHVHNAAHVQTIGDGTATSIAVTHNLGTTDVIVQIQDLSQTPDSVAEADYDLTDANTVTVNFSSAPANGTIRVIIVAAEEFVGAVIPKYESVTGQMSRNDADGDTPQSVSTGETRITFPQTDWTMNVTASGDSLTVEYGGTFRFYATIRGESSTDPTEASIRMKVNGVTEQEKVTLPSMGGWSTDLGNTQVWAGQSDFFMDLVAGDVLELFVYLPDGSGHSVTDAVIAVERFA